MKGLKILAVLLLIAAVVFVMGCERKIVNEAANNNTASQDLAGCFACHVRCKKVIQFEEPYRVDPGYGGPEYETLASLGSDCGIDDLKALLQPFSAAAMNAYPVSQAVNNPKNNNAACIAPLKEN